MGLIILGRPRKTEADHRISNGYTAARACSATRVPCASSSSPSLARLPARGLPERVDRAVGGDDADEQRRAGRGARRRCVDDQRLRGRRGRRAATARRTRSAPTIRRIARARRRPAPADRRARPTSRAACDHGRLRARVRRRSRARAPARRASRSTPPAACRARARRRRSIGCVARQRLRRRPARTAAAASCGGEDTAVPASAARRASTTALDVPGESRRAPGVDVCAADAAAALRPGPVRAGRRADSRRARVVARDLPACPLRPGLHGERRPIRPTCTGSVCVVRLNRRTAANQRAS